MAAVTSIVVFMKLSELLQKLKTPDVNERPFAYIYYVNTKLFLLASVVVCIGTYLNLFFFIASLVFCIAILAKSFCDAFYKVKPVLLLLEYDGEERHLFSKHIAIFNLLLTVGLTFLVAVIPAIFNYFHRDEFSPIRIASDIIVACLTSIASIQKNMLEHSRNVWIANRDR